MNPTGVNLNQMSVAELLKLADLEPTNLMRTGGLSLKTAYTLARRPQAPLSVRNYVHISKLAADRLAAKGIPVRWPQVLERLCGNRP